MSFGQQLANKAHAVHTKWVEETLHDFMKHCEAAAEKGEYKAELEPEVPAPLTHTEVINLLKEKVSELGFRNADAAMKQRLQGHYWYDTSQAQIWGTWDMAAELPEADAAPKGIKGNCPICHENRHLVALTPCGHTVCQQCQKSSELRQCPMCRANLTGATWALFMG